MIRKLKPFLTRAICAIAVGQAWAQPPRAVTLDIEWENSVGYLDDLPDPSKLVTSTGIPTLNLRNFMRFIAIADIISVNGKPAKGAWVLGGRLVQVFRSPMPGQAIGDLAVRGSMADIHLEILDNDGTPVGTIMISGFSSGQQKIPNSRPRPAVPTTAGSPIIASRILNGCSARRCCRCSRSMAPCKRRYTRRKN